jgi:hypothetical protein
MTINLVALKAELLTDPMAYGYAPLIADTNNPALAAMLNLRRAEIRSIRNDITPAEVRKQLAVGDFRVSQTTYGGSWLESLLQSYEPSINLKNPDGTDTVEMQNLLLILKDNSASENRIRALATRNGSRIEQLFGVDEIVSAQEVINALEL